jgi:Zn finger protein HypA/HybF involved in hydrogenase expression
MLRGRFFVLCRKCKVGMREERHVAHKKRKFTCPKCGTHRMEAGKAKRRDLRQKGRTRDGWD